MTVEEENGRLRTENQALREALRQTQELLGVALARIEELEKLKTPPPAFVKASVKKPEKEEKKAKKRDAKQIIADPDRGASIGPLPSESSAVGSVTTLLTNPVSCAILVRWLSNCSDKLWLGLSCSQIMVE